MDQSNFNFLCFQFSKSNVYSTKIIKFWQLSTAVEQAVAWAPVAHRARVRFPVGTCFLGEVFSGFFLTCKTNVRKIRPTASSSSSSSSLSLVFCPRTGPSLQAQERRLQFCWRQVFQLKLRNQGCNFTRDWTDAVAFPLLSACMRQHLRSLAPVMNDDWWW